MRGWSRGRGRWEFPFTRFECSLDKRRSGRSNKPAFVPRQKYRAPTHARQRSKRAPSRQLPSDNIVVLYGWHTVKAALENPARHMRRLLATENAARRLAADGVPLGTLSPELVRPDTIAQRLPPDAVHNGLLAEAD